MATGCRREADSEAGEGANATATARAEAAGSEPAADGEVPNACTAIPAAELAAALGAPGDPKPLGGGSRRVCMYSSGIVVGVSAAAQYEPSVAMAKGRSTCEEITGVADRAAFCVTGTSVGQLLWVDGGLMYDVTAARTDRAAFAPLARRR